MFSLSPPLLRHVDQVHPTRLMAVLSNLFFKTPSNGGSTDTPVACSSAHLGLQLER